MKISVVGAGYVGLVTAVGLAKSSHKVICVDKDLNKIKKLQLGKIPIFEYGLEDEVKKAITKNLLDFTADIEKAVNSSEIIFIAVGTPEKSGGAADLNSVRSVIENISKLALEDKIIVIKSTVPVGTAEEMIELIRKYQKPNLKITIVSNPEFLQQGKALEGVLKPDRIVIGAKAEKIQNIIKGLYKSIKTEFILTDNASAELIKYASNSFLATKISFINEMADLCEKTGADVKQVAVGMGMDPRINPHFLNAGIGYGGSCFPKDTKALHHIARGVGNRFKLLEAVIEVNQIQKFRFLDKVKTVLKTFKNKNIAVYGLAFKGDTDDIRESVSIEICKYLLDKKVKINAFDPRAMANAKQILPKINYCTDPYKAAKNVDAILVLAEWKEFKNLNFNKLQKMVRKSHLFDGRNFLDKNKIQKAGLKYFGVGLKDDLKS
ncbi:UDP-glucose dehydrogenase family protein [Patescibacteria group bacterium]